MSLLGGYNWHGSGNLVWGVEGALTGGAIDVSAPCTNPLWTCASTINYLATIRGRIGVAQDRTLFFATLGPALGSIRNSTQLGAGVPFQDTRTVAGMTLGIGFENARASGWNLRGDLEYYRFRDTTYNLDVPYVGNRTTAAVARLSLVRRF